MSASTSSRTIMIIRTDEKGGFVVIDSYSKNIMLSSGRWKDEREYWINMLCDSVHMSGFAPNQLDIGGRERPEAVHELELLAALAQRIVSLCGHADQGVYSLLLSAVIYVLH